MNWKYRTIKKQILAAYYSSKTNQGFVLSLAVLISGIILSISFAVFSNALKELTLSSSGRESQHAFYAADTGGECALYWDIRHPALPESAFATSTGTALPQGSGVLCNSEDITDPVTGWDPVSGWNVTQDGSAVTTTFDMKFTNGSCATVAVIKDSGTTKIDSRGFNMCDMGNLRRVERGLRISY